MMRLMLHDNWLWLCNKKNSGSSSFDYCDGQGPLVYYNVFSFIAIKAFLRVMTSRGRDILSSLAVGFHAGLSIYL